MEIVILLLAAIICLMIVLYVLIQISRNCLKIKKYTVVDKNLPKAFDGLKIAHITDVHSKIFGENNTKVIEYVEKINPDIVIMSGDIIHEREPDIDGFISMYEPIYKKYPVYYSIGNHERKLWNSYKKYKEYLDKLTKIGVHVIINGNEKYYKNNEYIVINALKFRENMQPKKLTKEREEKYIKYMKNKLGTIDESRYNILITHDPENFKMYDKLGVNMIFSGHVHGGLVRLGKLCFLSPRKRFFPKYSYGINRGQKAIIETSSGMGRARIDIRLFNRPEIVEVKLVSSKWWY